MPYRPGDRVVKNPPTWKPNEFDSWGRGVGVGVVVESPIPMGDSEVDVRWPGGRCFEDTAGLLPAVRPWGRHLALGLYLLVSAAFVVWTATRPVTVSGDGWEYLITLQSFWNHGTPDLRPGDFDAVLATFPEHHSDRAAKFQPGEPPGWAESATGQPFAVHFWAMPEFALPAKAALRWLGGSELAALPVSNAAWFFTATGLILFAGVGPLRRRLLFAGLAAVSPAVWYIQYGGVEVFCWSLAVAGLVAFDRRRFALSAFAFGLAATQNPPLAALVLLPAVAAWRLGWARFLAVIGLGGFVAAVPPLCYLWHFGTPSLLAPFADPSRISWRRTAGILTDLNQGLLPYVPVLLLAVPMAVAASVRRREWLWLPALLAVAAMVVAVQVQVNWNGDGRGLLRYLVWVIPPLAWVCARGLTGWMAWATLAWAVVLHGGILAFDPPTRWQYVEQRRIAAWVMSEQPTWYDPDPEIFVERQRGREADGADLSPHLPVLFGRSNGEVTKVLLDRRSVERLVSRFEKIEPATLEAMRAAAEATHRPTYYHPPEKTAWAAPWTIHGRQRE